jgi:hypothetical protein
MRAFELEVRKFTMFIALGNSSRGEQRLATHFHPAVATDDSAVRTGELPSTSTTDGTNFSGNLHHGVSLSMCTLRRASRKCLGWKLCAHPVELWDGLWRTEEKVASTFAARAQGRKEESVR